MTAHPDSRRRRSSAVWRFCVRRSRRARRRPGQPVARVASVASGSIQGIVRDEQGAPVSGAIVSALGATTAFATTDRGGKFELRTLSPGPYLVRAHLTGFVASRGQIIDVRPSSRASSSIALRHVGGRPVGVSASSRQASRRRPLRPDLPRDAASGRGGVERTPATTTTAKRRGVCGTRAAAS